MVQALTSLNSVAMEAADLRFSDAGRRSHELGLAGRTGSLI